MNAEEELESSNQLFHDVSLHANSLKQQINHAKEVLVGDSPPLSLPPPPPSSSSSPPPPPVIVMTIGSMVISILHSSFHLATFHSLLLLLFL